MADLDSLEVIFNRFASFGVHRADENDTELDGTKLAKLAKDCKVLDAKFNRNNVDLIFHKVKQPSKRKIDFDEFVRCTEEWAKTKGVSHADLVNKMVSQDAGPVLRGTVPDHVAFHDDKSRYTGVHKNGGPESVGKGGGHNPLANLLDRSPADVRGRKLDAKKKIPSKRLTKRDSDIDAQRNIEEKRIDRGDSNISHGDLVGDLHEDEPGVRREGTDFMLHPDWKRVANPRSAGAYDRFFYVNKVTNERSWSMPTVPVLLPDDDASA